MKKFSTSWKSSTKPNKQRKYRFQAPLHIRGRFMNAHLSKELRTKHGTRSLRLRVGDKVRIMRGQFKRQEGKVEEINLTYYKVYISKIEHTKRDGTKARYPVNPSNLMIVELMESKRRLQKNPKQKPEMKEVKPVKEKPAEKIKEKPVQKDNVETHDVKHDAVAKKPAQKPKIQEK